MKVKGLQPADVYGPPEIPYETFKADANGARRMNRERAEVYAPILGVPWLWLWLGIDPRLSQDEMDLIDAYRRATEAGKQAIRTVAMTVPSEPPPPRRQDVAS